MQLTPAQLRTLRYYHLHLDAPPTWVSFCKDIKWAFITWVLCGIVAYVVSRDTPWLAALLIGIPIGAMLREIRHQYAIIHAWPLIVEMLDRDRIEALLREADPLS